MNLTLPDGTLIANYEELQAWERRQQELQLTRNLSQNPTCWEHVIHGLGRDTFPLALLSWSYRCSDLDDLAVAIADAWTMPDNPQTQIKQADWLGYFRRVGFLDNDMRAPQPTESITVWRGSTTARRRRWSWTDDPEQAKWFAGRLRDAGLDGKVWTTTAPPEARLAHFHGKVHSRGEEEHVILTRGLRIVEAGVR